MLALNRSALVVRPRSPFLDWLHTVDPTSASLTLGSLTREPTIYLVSECLEIVVAAVERLSDRGHLVQVPCEGILDDVFGGTSAGRGELVQFFGRFGRDVHFHAVTVRL